MIFTNTCINYMMRVNISVNIVAMVPLTNTTYTQSQVTFDWTPYQRANILSGYFWGYLASNWFSGLIAERYGSRIVVFITVTLSSIFTILSPVAAKHSYELMLVARIAIGFFSGFLFPAMFTLIASWAVPNERGKFLGSIIGGTIGTFIAWTLCGVIIDVFHWEWGFYTFGIIGLLWCIPWWLLIYNTPNDHPRISLKEMQYINDGIKGMKKAKPFPPYRRILISRPVWSLLILTFGTGWGISFVVTAAPSYINSALGYKISSTGALSGMIYLCRSMASFLFGSIGDILLKRNILSVPVLRRVATVGSHIIPGCLVLCMVLPGFSPLYYVMVMTLALTLNGLVTLSSLANAYDLTSNFVGSITSLTVTLTTLSGILSPYVTAYFTKYKETYQEAWRPVFYTASLVYIVAGLQFIAMGSTKKQDWDKIESTETKKEIEL
ncbi:uncharacterized transporter slc-17.2-like isoform X2 [Epargyreus clarus]